MIRQLVRVGALVAILAPVAAAIGAGAAPPNRDAAIAALLAERDQAVRTGDRSGFLATLDPGASDAFRTAQGALFDGLHSIAFSKYESRLRIDEAGDLAPGLLAKYRTEAVFLPDVDVHFRLKDVDTVDAIDTYWYTFVQRDGKWRIIADTDVEDLGLQSARNPWDYGAVRTEASPHFTMIFNPADAARAHTLVGIAEAAYARLAGSVDRPVPARVPVILPHNIDQLREMIQATFDVSNFVAFASSGVDRDTGYAFTAPRVFIQDTNLSKYNRTFQLQTLHHEFVHVTAFPLAGPFDPSWVHEGTADWISQGKFAPQAVSGSDGLLPDDYEFTTGNQTSILRSYTESDSAVAFLAKAKGPRAPFDLLETIGRHRIEPGTERYWTSQALQTVYGQPFDDFQRAWNGGRR